MFRRKPDRAKKTPRRKKVHRKPDPSIRVKPSPEIDDRVAQEVQKATAAASALSAANLFDSGYLVSAIYYHDGLLAGFNADRRDADPADRIVARIAARIADRMQGVKRDYVALLREICADAASELGRGRFVSPVPHDPLSRSRNVHPYAIDLFTPEGTPVSAAARGIVVLAESEWLPGEWFSTSSVRGGNAVIVFSPDDARFFRYAHLESVVTRAGSYVETGAMLGRVGHTGFNADRKGHGHHLHFEINEYDDRTGLVSAVAHDDLEALLDAAAASGACPQSAASAEPRSDRG